MKAANDNEPLTLTRQQAAELCGLSPSGFDLWVRRGIVPGPIAGTRRWSRVAIQRSISGAELEPANDNASPFEEWKRSHAAIGQGH